MSELSAEAIENHLKEIMPEECLGYFKKYKLCRYNLTQELIKTKGITNFSTEVMTLPDANIQGCSIEHAKFAKCYKSFYLRYMDLKNYVALINGNHPPFDKQEIDKLNKGF